MHFDPRTQTALRDVGLDTDDLRRASDPVAEATDDAETVAAFLADGAVVYSDVETAHSATDAQEHAVDCCDLHAHADDVRGSLRFDSRGVPVEGARPLDDDRVELTLGPTVDDGVTFAADPGAP